MQKLRVLVVDDSSANRKALTAMLESRGEVEVVATAGDGEEGLKQALAHTPDAITLDLEMPRIDGFTFLRLLMARTPMPVIVISSYAKKTDVFKALELGAFDFIAKPGKELEPIAEELLAKIRLVRYLRRDALAKPPAPRTERVAPSLSAPFGVVAIGASTGGPPALQRILTALPRELPLAILVAQHMPERFTKAFAERLNKLVQFPVAEARGGETVAPGTVLVAPGGKHLRVEARGKELHTVVVERGAPDKYVPSIDTLFESLAGVAGPRTLGVLLTGMGNDGAAGIRALKRSGAATLAESEATAVIYGMPKEAIATGCVDRVVPLDDVAEELGRFARGQPTRR